MSDHDNAPDPIDRAYLEAEAVLADDAARAARRARVLAAVTRGDRSPATAHGRRPDWRRGGALAAAAVAGLSVLLAVHLRQTTPLQGADQPAARENAAGDPPARAAAPAVDVQATDAPPAPPPAAPPPLPEPNDPEITPAPSGRTAPPEAFAAPAAEASPPPAAPPPARAQAPPPPPAPRDAVVTARRAPSALTSQRLREPGANDAAQAQKGGAPRAADQTIRLGDAAAAGRMGEVKALLAQGVPIDAADADGETALMKSIRAGQATIAGYLHERGASLDRENMAGETAREIAIEMGDARLDEALGLAPSRR